MNVVHDSAIVDLSSQSEEYIARRPWLNAALPYFRRDGLVVINLRDDLEHFEVRQLVSSDPQPIPKARPLATGAETGIDVVTDPLAPHHGLTGGDWATLSGLVVLGALGVYLAVRFRPHNLKAG